MNHQNPQTLSPAFPRQLPVMKWRWKKNHKKSQKQVLIVQKSVVQRLGVQRCPRPYWSRYNTILLAITSFRAANNSQT